MKEEDLLSNSSHSSKSISSYSSLQNFEQSINSQKLKAFIINFQEAYSRFRLSKFNSFLMKSPSVEEVRYLLNMWRKRPLRSIQFLLHLEIIEGQLTPQQYMKEFSLYPSIKLKINGVAVENNNILDNDKEYSYEGNQTIMSIISDEREMYYFGNVVNRKPHGKGEISCRPRHKDGYLYMGEFSQGKMQGRGQQKNNNNIFYEGEFKNDFKHGQGIQIQKKRKKNPVLGEDPLMEKSRYLGQFSNGLREGKGKQETAYGIYEGEWKQGMRCGYGEFKYKNGDFYSGEWKDNEFNGKGKYKEGNDNEYTGEFKAGKYNGSGVMIYKNGDSYVGEWENGKKHGQGYYKWADQDYYDGSWVKDNADGDGTSMIGSQFYVGQFKNGKRHGIGELSGEDGNLIKAFWVDNKRTGIIEINGEIQLKEKPQ